MQSVKYFLRAIGDASKGMGIVSSQDAENDLTYNYLSQGFVIQSTSFVGTIKDQEGNDAGYRVMHVLVKDEEPKKVTVREAKS